MEQNRPLLICLTSTRNYGWVTNAFLKANSLWADYIIIVDQMSTDGTRELALANPKVILLDNKDMTYSETKRSEMAINRAREIEGDKILIYLAIDEVLPANVQETEDWKRICNSQKGETFVFEWANLLPDQKKYYYSTNKAGSIAWMARGFHDDNITPYNNQGLDMHTHCIPYPESPIKETKVKDFRILHFGSYNTRLNRAKNRFYQVVDFDKNKRTAVQMFRMYKNFSGIKIVKDIEKEWIHTIERENFNLFDEIDMNADLFFDHYILNFIKVNGIKHYSKLTIWDSDFLERYNLKDPRNFFIKTLHKYFELTKNVNNLLIIRAIDKVLKKIDI